MILGLTGGIASGKSTVAGLLEKDGAVIINADIIAREVIADAETLEKIRAELGDGIFDEKGLNRRALRELIFANEEFRNRLNEIMHPAIIKRMVDEIEERRAEKLVVVDVPLLYETGFEKYVEKVAVVYVSREMQIARLMIRDKISKEEAEMAIASQMHLEEKRKRADIIIDNGGSLEELKREIEEKILERKMYFSEVEG